MIVPPKRIDLLLRVLQGREPLHVHAVETLPRIEGLDHGIVRRRAAPTEIEDHATGARPEVHRRIDELRAVVAVNTLRHTAFESESLTRGGDIVAPESVADVDGQALARAHVDDGQGTEAAPIGELIRDEIHTPDVVARGHRGRAAGRPRSHGGWINGPCRGDLLRRLRSRCAAEGVLCRSFFMVPCIVASFPQSVSQETVQRTTRRYRGPDYSPHGLWRIGGIFSALEWPAPLWLQCRRPCQ